MSVSRGSVQTISQAIPAQTNIKSDPENQKEVDYKNDPRVINMYIIM